MQARPGQARAGQGRAGQGRAGQGRAGQGRAGQGRAGQGRAGQGRAGQNNLSQRVQIIKTHKQDIINTKLIKITYLRPLHCNINVTIEAFYVRLYTAAGLTIR